MPLAGGSAPARRVLGIAVACVIVVGTIIVGIGVATTSSGSAHGVSQNAAAPVPADHPARFIARGAERPQPAPAAPANLAADQRYADLAASLQGGGKPWPGGKLDNWPVPGTVTSPFGARWGGFHNGVDVAARFGIPVRAAAAGVIQVVGKPYLASGDTATVIIISHASDLSTFYGHLDDTVRPPIVRAGQTVRAGEVIGYNGSTGWSTGPHVHFMTIFDRRAVDPMRFLP